MRKTTKNLSQKWVSPGSDSNAASPENESQAILLRQSAGPHLDVHFHAQAMRIYIETKSLLGKEEITYLNIW
jgi:hypothetical protein